MLSFVVFPPPYFVRRHETWKGFLGMYRHSLRDPYYILRSFGYLYFFCECLFSAHVFCGIEWHYKHTHTKALLLAHIALVKQIRNRRKGKSDAHRATFRDSGAVFGGGFRKGGGGRTQGRKTGSSLGIRTRTYWPGESTCGLVQRGSRVALQ